ncbi:Metallo-dependent hydrolase [Zopfia rhizophila CBS 207.26]|uniref:Metallo-dependent hydrolase n=1 Tax=Zopfia rhizophila CBS 207.26 TaxID=1314779 RepID=A0A6A6EJ55_9PEZI|nr:Metallo-dependent hydrolase [Zopfia rhizophila CBS 207.26]
MPIDPESNNSSGSNKTRQGWLARCGLLFTTLSVRDRHSKEGEPNRLVMSGDKKSDKFANRKRKRNESPGSRMLINMREKRDPIDVFEQELKVESNHRAYKEEKAKLLTAEDTISWDKETRVSASPIEKRAGELIGMLREFERDVIFGNLPSEDIPDENTRDMGGQFLTNKDRIENKSKIFEIAKSLPKGALLHLHFNAELHPERLLEEARSMPNMFIRSTRPLLKIEDLELTEMVFNVMPADTAKANIFSADYQGERWRDPIVLPYVWMEWSEFRVKFVKHFRNQYKQEDEERNENGVLPNSSEQGPVMLEPAENWIKHKMVLSEKEAYGLTQTVNGVWARFNQATRCFKGLMNYEKVYKWYISNAIDRMIDERVMYAELRPMLMDKSIPSNDGRTKLDLEAQMNMILDGVKEKQAQLKKDGREELFPFGLKIIYCTPRSIGKPKMQTEMQDCINLKVKFPDLICGFDLVGAEDRPNHIGHYFEELAAFQKTCEKQNLDIPFLFHAGETLLDTGGSKEPSNSNLYDAVVLKSKRIGHGYSLMKHPHLIEHFKLKKTEGKVDPGICIELCPISNELLHLCRNVKEHPYPQLLAAGVPCTVNSDNPSLFSNSMSHEFYQIMVGSPTITIHSWKQLALWSLEYSCLSEEQKKKGIGIFKKDWDDFCQWVVDKYEQLFDAANWDEVDDQLRDAYKVPRKPGREMKT